MSYYNGTIQRGSQGENTRRWQDYLNSNGYAVNVNGIFDDATESATKEYQTAMGLIADGIVNNTTWSKAGFSDLSTPVSAPKSEPLPTMSAYDTTSYDDTEEGSAAKAAYNTAKDAVKNLSPFQYTNQEQLNSVMNKILNGEKFSYDLNGDALYQQYKDKYIQQGKLAMGDAIGQASAMTGGYGNSYAQSVGQQAYQNQLDNLNDIVPELYQMALDQYNMNKQDLYNQYGMLTDDYSRAYGEYTDKYNKLLDALGIAQSDYYNGADIFHTEQNTKNDIASKTFDDAMSIWNANNDTAWNQTEWDESNRRYEAENLAPDENAIVNASSEDLTFATYDDAVKYMTEHGLSEEDYSEIVSAEDFNFPHQVLNDMMKAQNGDTQMIRLLLASQGIDPREMTDEDVFKQMLLLPQMREKFEIDPQLLEYDSYEKYLKSAVELALFNATK